MNKQEKEVFVPVEAPKIDPMLIVRVIVYLLAIVNTGVMAIFGTDLGLKVDQATLYEGISILFLAGAFIDGVWRNQNFTKKARKRDVVAKQAVPDDKK